MKTSENKGTFEERHPKLAFALPKVASVAIVAGLWFCMSANQAAIDSNRMHDITQRFRWETWGNVSLIAAIVLIFVLSVYYRGMYSVFWGKSVEASLDERQKALRNRIFLRSYRWMILLLWLVLIRALQNPEQRIQIYAAWVTVILMIGLPSIIASFHKNAR